MSTPAVDSIDSLSSSLDLRPILVETSDGVVYAISPRMIQSSGYLSSIVENDSTVDRVKLSFHSNLFHPLFLYMQWHDTHEDEMTHVSRPLRHFELEHSRVMHVVNGAETYADIPAFYTDFARKLTAQVDAKYPFSKSYLDNVLLPMDDAALRATKQAAIPAIVAALDARIEASLRRLVPLLHLAIYMDHSGFHEFVSWVVTCKFHERSLFERQEVGFLRAKIEPIQHDAAFITRTETDEFGDWKGIMIES